MRSKMIVCLIFMASSSMFASTSVAQQPAQEQQQPANPAVPAQRPMAPGGMGPGMMSPEMMQMMGPMFGRSQDAGRRGGPLQRVSRLLSALDDPRVRSALGLTDQQADRLRKIIVDTETFTIKTAADIAVNSIELRELLRADKPDRTAVMSKGDQVSKSTSLLINHYLDAMLAAKALLTPEQERMIRAYMERGAPALPAPPTRP